MSYYANEEDDDVLVTPDHRVRRGSRKGSSKRRSSSKKSSRNTDKLIDHDLNDDVVDDDDEVVVVADDIVMVGSDEDRKSKRLQAKRQESRSKSRERRLRAKQGEDGRNSRILFSKRKSSKKKSRREQVYDDLYGTDYHEVDDGIVGCADALCVGNTDVFEDEAAKGAATKDVNNKKTLTSILPSFNSKSKTADNDTSLSSPNTGEQNKVDDSEEVYVVRQRYGYFSIFFGVIQIIVLGLMMWQCGIAPMNINPMFGPYPDALSEWGGKNSILIVEDGEWWRLFTPILLHAGVIHLLCNVAVQLELGVFFEREWGSMTWLTIYMTSALGSSVLSVITMPDAVSVGSSGAVMGLFGGKLAEIICRSCEKQDTAQDRVAHQVRKEQCLGVTCSVIVVLAFSFIPYGKSATIIGFVCVSVAFCRFHYVGTNNSTFLSIICLTDS